MAHRLYFGIAFSCAVLSMSAVGSTLPIYPPSPLSAGLPLPVTTPFVSGDASSFQFCASQVTGTGSYACETNTESPSSNQPAAGPLLLFVKIGVNVPPVSLPPGINVTTYNQSLVTTKTSLSNYAGCPACSNLWSKLGPAHRTIPSIPEPRAYALVLLAGFLVLFRFVRPARLTA